jgi:hypothetical protein
MERLTFQTIITGDLSVDVTEVELQNQKDRCYRVSMSDGKESFIAKNKKGVYYAINESDLKEADIQLIGQKIEEQIN